MFIIYSVLHIVEEDTNMIPQLGSVWWDNLCYVKDLPMGNYEK